MGHQKHGRTILRSQLVDEIKNALLDCDVERARRLVCDDQLRLQRNRHSDQDPLAHAARQFMRILPRPKCRLAQADAGQKREHPGLDLVGSQRAVDPEHLAKLRADRLDRVERTSRILRHEADPRAAHRIQLPIRPAGNVGSIQLDGSAFHSAIRSEQTDDRLCGRRLAGTGFTDKGHNLTWIDAKRNVMNGAAFAAAVSVGNAKILDLENGGKDPGMTVMLRPSRKIG